VPDLRTDNARHGLCELLVVAFVVLLFGATSCADLAGFGRAKKHVFRGLPKFKLAIPSLRQLLHGVPVNQSVGAGCARNYKDSGPANIAVLRRCALDLARRRTSKVSLSIKLKRAGWSHTFLLSLLNQLKRVALNRFHSLRL